MELTLERKCLKIPVAILDEHICIQNAAAAAKYFSGSVRLCATL